MGSGSTPTITSVAVNCSPASILTTQTSACTPTVKGTGSFNSSVTWSVSPSSVGAVSSAGVFTPTAAGTATITATSTQDLTKSGSAAVTVSAPPTITSVSVVCAPAAILTTQTSACTPTVTGTGSFSSSVTWSVSPSSVGAVSSAGVFTPTAAGTATITATSTQDLTKSGSATVEVATSTLLVITISDLPPGALANVTVTDPNGQQTKLTSSQTINAISGTYTITAAAVVAGTSTYHAALPSQAVSVISGATSTASVIYSTIIPNTTKVLDAAGMSALTVSPDGSTITLPESSPVAAALAVGDVLASAPTTAAPNGLLVRIVSVSNSGGTVSAGISQATLEDAIQQGTLSFSQTLGPNNTQSATLGQEARRARPMGIATARPEQSPGSSPCTGNSNTISLPYDETLAKTGTSSISLAGEIDLCPSFQFALAISGFQLSSFTATATIGTNAEVNLEGSWQGSFDKTHNLATINGPITRGLIGDVPVVLQPTLTPFIGISGNASAGFVTGVTLDSQTKLGVTYSNGQWGIVDLATAPTAEPATTAIDAALSVKGFAGVKAGVLLYGLVTPYMAPDGFLQFDASASASPWWTVTAGFEGNVGVSAGILNKNYSSSELTLYSTTVAQAGGPFSVSSASPTLTSVTPNMATAGGFGPQIAVTGSNFVPDSVVNFNGQPIATTFIDTTDLSAQVLTIDIGTPGMYPITVVSPDTAGATSQPANFTVTPPLAVASLSFSPASIAPGASTTGTVTLNFPAPSGGVLIGLMSSNTSVLPVPAAVEVQGGMTTATFTTTGSSSVTAATKVSVSASYGSSSQSATVTVAPVTAVASLSFSPASIAPGASTTGTVTLNFPAPSAGVLIGLMSSNTSVLPVPAAVEVQGGMTTATFTTTGSSSVTAATKVSVSASYGSSSQSATVTVAPVTLAYSETVLYNFCSAANCTDGAYPLYAGLIQDADGNLYGTTFSGGAGNGAGNGGSGVGTVFKVDNTGHETVLYSFCSAAYCTDGVFPYAGLIQDADGNLYGTTEEGGVSGYGSASGDGTVFKVDNTGHETVLYSFCSAANCTDGSNPYAGLIQDAAGNLYGTTEAPGGANGGGTVFKVDNTGHETVLYNFCSAVNCTDGFAPSAGVIEDAAGNLYGTTVQGGANNGGTVFKVDNAGHETVLYNFCSAANCTDGQHPAAGLIQDAAGNIYGTTLAGGANYGTTGVNGFRGGGTVFRVDNAGHETVLYNFCSASNCTDGFNPYAGLIQDAAGNLYGTTFQGGANYGTTGVNGYRGGGTVFRVDNAGHETVLYSFCSAANCTDGSSPYAGLIQDPAGNLYGTTFAGGANYGTTGVNGPRAGTVFKLAPQRK